jgi:outer membrane protein OmpA-like peptidoglycan-associated protein
MAILALAALALAGCATVRNARDRIVRREPVCNDVTIPIYFAPDAATITPDGRRLIAAEAARAKHCTVKSVRVMGLADAAGDPAANLELSKARAASVAEAIQKAGLPAAEFEVAAAGDAGSVTKKGALQPVRRRADITIDLASPKTP